MAYYKAVYSNEAIGDLEKLDRPIKERIIKKIDDILKMKNPLLVACKLRNLKISHYRFRIGDYRIIFRIDKQTGELVILVVVRIDHRKDAYRKKLD